MKSCFLTHTSVGKKPLLTFPQRDDQVKKNLTNLKEQKPFQLQEVL